MLGFWKSKSIPSGTCATPQPVPPSPWDVKPVLKRLESLAEHELSDISNCLHEMSRMRTFHEASEVARRVINAGDHLLQYVSTIAQLYPTAATVVKTLHQIIYLERLRHEHDPHIAQIHSSMVHTVFNLKILVPITYVECELKDHMERTFKQMAATLQEFGQFVDFYYKCWQKTFRVLMDRQHKEKLEHFHLQFDKHRLELERIVVAHLPTLSSCCTNAQYLLERLPVFDRDVMEAQLFVEATGGATRVIQDDELLERLSMMLGERITDNMKLLLREGFHASLQKHAEIYDLKMCSFECKAILAMNASHVDLCRQFNVDPYKLIEEKDIRAIWKQNGWRFNVKSQVFVEALYDYYQQQFIKHNVGIHMHHEDAWAIEFFSRMMYHSAIGDFADEDGSGFFTVSEMNTLCSTRGLRLRHWSIPQWFAFCASGWYNNNAWYYGCVKSMMKELSQELNAVKSDEHGRWKLVKTIVAQLKPILKLNEEDISESAAPHHLRRLQEEFRRLETSSVMTNAQKFHYRLEDESAVVAVMGDTRIELHIMCIFFILITRLHHIVCARARHGHIMVDEVGSIEDLTISCMTVHLAFERRMNELMRGWRLQGRNVELQLDRYADGLFRNVQREASERASALNKLCKALFDGDTTPMQYRSLMHSGTVSPPRTNTMGEQLDAMAAQLLALTSKVESLEKALLAFSTLSQTSPSEPSPPAAQGKRPSRIRQAMKKLKTSV